MCFVCVFFFAFCFSFVATPIFHFVFLQLGEKEKKKLLNIVNKPKRNITSNPVNGY